MHTRTHTYTADIKQQFKKSQNITTKHGINVCVCQRGGASYGTRKYPESFNDILQCNTLLICYFFTGRINLKPIINEFCNQNMIIVD